MKIQKIVFVIAALAMLAPGTVLAQETHDVEITIAGVAMLAVNDPATAVALTTQQPADAGNPVTGSSDSKAIYYTVLTAIANPYRITAQIDAAPPAGTAVSVTANPGAGNGTSAGAVTLGLATQDIITAIGSTATGRDPATPPELTYTLMVTNPGDLVAGTNATITVTLTLTDG